MNVLALFHSASARIEEKIYGIQVGLSVYVGLVRASIQEKVPFLQNHVWMAVGLSLVVVFAIQFIILLVATFAFLLSTTAGLPKSLARFTRNTIQMVPPLRSIR